MALNLNAQSLQKFDNLFETVNQDYGYNVFMSPLKQPCSMSSSLTSSSLSPPSSGSSWLDGTSLDEPPSSVLVGFPNGNGSFMFGPNFIEDESKVFNPVPWSPTTATGSSTPQSSLLTSSILDSLASSHQDCSPLSTTETDLNIMSSYLSSVSPQLPDEIFDSDEENSYLDNEGLLKSTITKKKLNVSFATSIPPVASTNVISSSLFSPKKVESLRTSTLRISPQKKAQKSLLVAKPPSQTDNQCSKLPSLPPTTVCHFKSADSAIKPSTFNPTISSASFIVPLSSSSSIVKFTPTILLTSNDHSKPSICKIVSSSSPVTPSFGQSVITVRKGRTPSSGQTLKLTTHSATSVLPPFTRIVKVIKPKACQVSATALASSGSTLLSSSVVAISKRDERRKQAWLRLLRSGDLVRKHADMVAHRTKALATCAMLATSCSRSCLSTRGQHRS